MRFERLTIVFSLAVAVVASACGRVLQDPNPDSGADGGHDSGAVACRQLDEAACRARTDCAVGACSLCGGGASFISCYNPATESPPLCVGLACPALCSSLDEASCKMRTDCRVRTCPDCNGVSRFSGCTVASDLVDTCPAIACPAPCSILDEASCRTRTDCRAATCPDCNGGSRFIGCLGPDDDYGCPAIACPVPCAQMTTKDACDARPDCHAVFVDGHDCACSALGCCARFSGCGAGPAVCSAPKQITCTLPRPYCEGPYVVSYAGGCYEGCVQSSDCAVN